MKRIFPPAEGTPEREGWDQCLDVEPANRSALLGDVTRNLADGNEQGRRWARGWLDAWDTHGSNPDPDDKR